MIRVFFLFLFLIYYWYFYASSSENVTEPSAGSPSAPPLYQCEFESNRPNHFRFTVNGTSVWEHTLTAPDFTFHQSKIVKTGPCHGLQDHALIPAKGKSLYDYLKLNPEVKNLPSFKENSEFTVQKGTVFYFECMGGHIERLQICPSGTTLIENACQDVDRCTGKQNGTRFPHPIHASKYVVCEGERETVSSCPHEHIFYHDRCESIQDLTHYCQSFPNSPFLYDDETRIECRNGKLAFFRCKSGMKFIDDIHRCEFSICVGKPDGERIPLPVRETFPFHFVPGYLLCENNKIKETVECPQDWDDFLSKGDDLTSLPMVFDGQKCSVPSFCENVFSKYPDTVVPLHEFTKRVKNWDFSKFLDRSAGYACEGNVRKRKRLRPGEIISKRFRAESGCQTGMPQKLPIVESPNSFYDCSSKQVIDCPVSTFFNGSVCVSRPVDVFNFNNVPLFKFDSLNLENWIGAWDYQKTPEVSCQNPESSRIILYNICSHPDCTHFAFLSQIPELSILLPGDHRAKCKFYEQERTLKKESVDFEYDFWTQKILTKDVKKQSTTERCVPGESLQTGNFVWDSTVFATCNLDQPFVFCPSKHSGGIIPTQGGKWVCKPPSSESFEFQEDDWFSFEKNEIKRILPMYLNDNTEKQIKLNKSDQFQNIPDEGLEVPMDIKINLYSKQPVRLQPRYRVTHPPNVVFSYTDGQQPEILVGDPDGGFLVKRSDFTKKSLSFPKYTPIHFVEFLKNIINMDERSLAHGVLFYSSVYINCVLLSVGVKTGSWIFIFLILLTMGLTAYMMYVATHNSDHLKNVGKWAEKSISDQLQKFKHLF